MNEPTNSDIMDMLKAQNVRLSSIENMVQRATGMWILSKWIAGGLLALGTLWASLHNWWRL